MGLETVHAFKLLMAPLESMRDLLKDGRRRCIAESKMGFAFQGKGIRNCQNRHEFEVSENRGKSSIIWVE